MSNKTQSFIKTVPRLKTIMGIVKFVDNPIDVIDQAIKEYGKTYYSYIGGTKKLMMTSDPDIIQHILQKNNKNYYKSELQTQGLGKYVGYGLLTIDGDYWLKQRRLIQPGFHKSKLKALVQIMNEEIDIFIENLNAKLEHGDQEMDISFQMMELTLRVVSRTLFGSAISDEQIRDLGTKINEVQQFLVKEIRQPIFNWYRKISGQEARAFTQTSALKDLILEFISERRKSGARHDDLLDMLMYSKYEDTGEYMSNQQVIDESLILFVAGHETTVNALTWTLYLLDQYPDIKNKLLKEHQQFYDQEPLGFDELGGLEYTKKVISESMRMYPPAWITDRVALEDDITDDFSIRKGYLVGLYIYGVHHDPEIWQNPSTFDPTRFDREKVKERHKFAYFPFGGGPRLCIGHHFAMMEMQLSLLKLLRNFTFKLAKDQEIDILPLVTLRPRHGMKMVVSSKIKT